MLQGFYQSNQATAAACQVNNLHLLRGMLGRPGAGIYQMNGQPTAQNTRETGADGDLSGFRNWENKQHIRELAELWNVDEDDHPALVAADARDADLALRRAGLDQAVVDLPRRTRRSRFPSSERVRANPREGDDLMVVVQDMFLTETAVPRGRRLTGGGMGREAGHVHERGPHGASLGARPSRPPGEARSGPRHLPRVRRAAWAFETETAAPLDQVARRRIGLRGLEGLFPPDGRATTPA